LRRRLRPKLSCGAKERRKKERKKERRTKERKEGRKKERKKERRSSQNGSARCDANCKLSKTPLDVIVFHFSHLADVNRLISLQGSGVCFRTVGYLH